MYEKLDNEVLFIRLKMHSNLRDFLEYHPHHPLLLPTPSLPRQVWGAEQEARERLMAQAPDLHSKLSKLSKV